MPKWGGGRFRYTLSSQPIAGLSLSISLSCSLMIFHLVNYVRCLNAKYISKNDAITWTCYNAAIGRYDEACVLS